MSLSDRLDISRPDKEEDGPRTEAYGYVGRPTEAARQASIDLSRPTNELVPNRPLLYRRLNVEDEWIYTADTPGKLELLGFTYFDFGADYEVPGEVTESPVVVQNISLGEREVMIIMDWRIYALKNISGNLEPMFPAEIRANNFYIDLTKGSSGGTVVDRSISLLDNDKEQNAVMCLATSEGFTWPGRFCHIIRGRATLRVKMHYRTAIIAPYTTPYVVGTQISGFRRQQG